MKRLYTILIGSIVALALLCLCWMAGWLGKKAGDKITDEEISVLIDQTDHHRLKFTAADFVRFRELGIRRQRFVLNVMPLTQVDVNPRYSMIWSEPIPLFSNPYTLRSRVSEFARELDDTLRRIQLNHQTQRESHLGEVIASEVSRLSASGRSRCTVFVYSDLRQRSSCFDIYNAGHKRRLVEHKTEIISELRKLQPVKPARNVVVVFLYAPQTTEENEDFLLMSDLFRSIFEEAGAKVIIAANLNAHI